MGFVYKITNDINNKVYIGKTHNNIQKRFQEHCRDCHKETFENRPLYRAMNKYGVEHFHIELVEETDNPEEREIYWIEQYNSYHDGYNATLGGDGKCYLDRKLLIDTYLQYQNAVEAAKILGISADHLRDVLRENNIKIKSSQDIAREKLSKTIYMLDKQTEEEIQSFASIKDAANFIKTSQNKAGSDISGITVHIRQVAQGKRKSAYGYIWKFE